MVEVFFQHQFLLKLPFRHFSQFRTVIIPRKIPASFTSGSDPSGGPIRPKRPFGQNWSIVHLSDCSLLIGPEWSRVKCTETETLQGGRQAALQLYFGILSLLMKRLSIQLEQKMQILPKGNVLVIGDSIIRWLFSRITWLLIIFQDYYLCLARKKPMWK